MRTDVRFDAHSDTRVFFRLIFALTASALVEDHVGAQRVGMNGCVHESTLHSLKRARKPHKLNYFHTQLVSFLINLAHFVLTAVLNLYFLFILVCQ